MSKRPVIITPKLIRRHNLRCVGRILLWASGSGAVFLVVFLFVWLLASLIAGHRMLTPPILALSLLTSVTVFWIGHRHLKKHGPQDWERVAQRRDRKPGMRLSRMSNQEYGQVGQGLVALILSGPAWLVKIAEEWRAIIPSTEEMASDLERLRQHFAAREGWVPMKDFKSHEAEIYLLVKLEILAIRELLAEWHFHVTVKGTVTRNQEFDKA